MAKGNRGLPPSFKIDIPDRPKPVDLGDYLDEVEAAPIARPAPKPTEHSHAHALAPSPAPLAVGARAPENVVEFPQARPSAPARPEATDSAPQPQPPPEPKAQPDVQTQLKRRRRRIPKAPPRKQINTTPETQRMIDEIIDYVQSYSVQRDAKASEIFHALVLALHESMEFLDLSSVPARGRWGTPTAQAFPISLKSAIKAAIAHSHKKNQR